MPIDHFAVLNALLRAEASRDERPVHATAPEPEPAPAREAPAAGVRAPAREEHAAR
ncbi:hypothetical protein [Streptomyces sp. NPDC008121]|uniref:hypothetical protein n=1 Tax=Streptomyces sp. NPDC008121 TaxID=3364809 RepID=UPI0036EA3486